MGAAGAYGMLASRRGKESITTAVTNARFASLHGLPVAPYPSRRRPLRSQIARSSRAAFAGLPQTRRASACGSAAAVSLRLRFARRSSSPSAPLFPLAEPQTEARSKPYHRIQKDRPSGSEARSANAPKLASSESIHRLPRFEYIEHSQPLSQPVFLELDLDVPAMRQHLLRISFGADWLWACAKAFPNRLQNSVLETRGFTSCFILLKLCV